MADEVLHITEQPVPMKATEGSMPGAAAGVPVAASSAATTESASAAEPVRITVRPNGPLRVEGHIILQDADGKTWDLAGKPAVSLCRCGLSEKRPFCDGSHNRQGWQCNASPALLT